MSSLTAYKMGLEVGEKLLKGTHINLSRIALQKGYANSVARSIKSITKTISYKKGLEPTLKQLETERQDVLNAMQTKDLTKEKYAVLVSSFDTLTKNIQILGGKSINETPQPIISITFNDNRKIEVSTDTPQV